MPLVLVPGHRQSRDVDDWYFDVFDNGRKVGLIHRINSPTQIWFWGVSFQSTGWKRRGYADTREDAMAALKAEYEKPA